MNISLQMVKHRLDTILRYSNRLKRLDSEHDQGQMPPHMVCKHRS